MAAELPRLLTPEDLPVTSLEQYSRSGGCLSYQSALRIGPDSVIESLRTARLRGRGGAGFPTAVKWSGVKSAEADRKFICCNGAEGEPGSFKDRFLLRHNPYQVIEGLAIGAATIGAERAYICLKRNFEREADGVGRALAEMQSKAGIGANIELVLGPDEYLFGEEKALLEVIEGGLPLPRVFPPYIHGLFAGAYGGATSNPTVVNNVETLSHVTRILRDGPDSFLALGTQESPGTMVFTISGDVVRPTVRELPLGRTLRELIFDVAGGLREGRQIKAVFPGLAGPVITPDLLDVPLGFDSMKRAGTAMGSGGFMIYDDSACMVQAAHMFSRFLHVESCNQCPPCKLGSQRITDDLDRILTTGQPDLVDDIWLTTEWVENNQRCFLASSEALVMASLVRRFPDDFSRHLTGSCDLRHDLVLPKMTDYNEASDFTFDMNYGRKQPDWSYTDL